MKSSFLFIGTALFVGTAASPLLFFQQHKFILKRFWAPHYNRRLPHCPDTPDWTCEHVVPRSLFPKNESSRVVNDLNNLLLFPKYLNNMRSSLRYSESPKVQGEQVSLKSIKACQSTYLYCVHCPLKGQINKDLATNETVFVPPAMWKGQIARAVIEMSKKYPRYKTMINTKVLRLQTAHEWDMLYPMSEVERVWKDIIDRMEEPKR